MRLANVEVEMPPFKIWRLLPSNALEIQKEEAAKIVHQCESFYEFHVESGLPYDEASEMWEAAW